MTSTKTMANVVREHKVRQVKTGHLLRNAPLTVLVRLVVVCCSIPDLVLHLSIPCMFLRSLRVS
jgi:hypothetical protein